MQKAIVAVGAAAVLALTHKQLVYWLRRRTSTVRLTYFNIAGLGEPIRYVLALAGVPFDDYRFKDRDEVSAAPRPPRTRRSRVAAAI